MAHVLPAGTGMNLPLCHRRDDYGRRPRRCGDEPAWAAWGSGRLEIACVDRDGGVIIDTSVDPGVPISREATLVHGITDAGVRGKPGVHRVMEELEPLLEQHGLIASHNVRFTRTALNSSLGRERIGFHRPMTMCAMKTYAGFRSEMNPATGEHAWASLAQIELYVDPDQQGDTHRQERRLTGLLEALPSEVNREVEADALAREVRSTSGIEGEILGPDQVRSCVAARLGLDAGKSLRPIPAVEGIVRIMVDATAGYREELTEERILGWHSCLFPNGIPRDQPVRAGAWRTGPTRVISGLMARERVLPGPEPEQIPSEMRAFLEWFNSPPETDGVLRAATAQLWFSAVHPFEDGNGRIARAITDMALAQSQNSPMRLYSMSQRILQERNAYCRDIERATLETTETCDTTAWLSRFARCFGQAIDDALDMLYAGQAIEDALEALCAARQNSVLMERTGGQTSLNSRQLRALEPSP